jgi:membrane protein
MWRAVSERNLGLIAAGVAFFAMLAVFPGIAAVIALWGFMSDPAVIEVQLQLLRDFLPEDAFALLSRQVYRLVATHDSTLGWASAVSIGVTLWSARLGVGALIQGLNAAHGTNNRGGLKHTVIALTLTFTLMGVTMVAMAAIVVLPIVLAFVPLGGFTALLVTVGKWIVSLSVVLLGMSLLLRYGPNRRPRTAWISPGLALSATLWAAASVLFSWFMGNFGNYNEIYGSLAAVVALLIWFYISAYAVLLGAVLNAEIEIIRKWRAAVEDGARSPQHSDKVR